jgi:hypothetical protein
MLRSCIRRTGLRLLFELFRGVWGWCGNLLRTRPKCFNYKEQHRSAALLDELGKRERELDGISEELIAADGNGLDARLQEIERFVQKRLQAIRGLLFADVPRTKAELSKHCTAITLTPEGSPFRIAGDWNLLGGRSDGAGGQNRTGYARLFRAALYQ